MRLFQESSLSISLGYNREKADIGVLLCLEDVTKPMRTEAASTGFYDKRMLTFSNSGRLQT